MRIKRGFLTRITFAICFLIKSENRYTFLVSQQNISRIKLQHYFIIASLLVGGCSIYNTPNLC